MPASIDFLRKFKLDSHHKMERFSILFVFFMVTLGVLFAISAKIHFDHKKITLDKQALYTEKTVWSLTGQKVRVIDIFRNNDSSRIFILFQTGSGSGDMTNMSIDANDYRIFLTGFNGEKLTNNPQAAYYVFGNTGYMGMYFVDSRQFDPHMYDIVVRNTNVLVTDAAVEASSEYDDPSFADFNQIRIFANFAGSDATVADFLNKDNPTIQEVYAECVASLREEPVRVKLDEDLLLMNNQMNLANQYANQLSTYNIRVPDLPVALAGDGMTLDESLAADNPTCFDKSMVNSRGNIIQSEYNTASETVQQFECVASQDARAVVPGQAVGANTEGDTEGDASEAVDSNGEPIEDANAGRLYLITDYVFPGGFQFNYQETKLADARLNELKPDSMSFAQWVESKKIEMQTYPTIKSGIDKSYYDTWYMTDGTIYEYSSEIALDSDQAAHTAINNYVNAISTIYATKYKYQTKDLYNFLKLQASSDTSDQMFSINTNENVLTMYES